MAKRRGQGDGIQPSAAQLQYEALVAAYRKATELADDLDTLVQAFPTTAHWKQVHESVMQIAEDLKEKLVSVEQGSTNRLEHP